jgi:hypothetical protein
MQTHVTVDIRPLLRVLTRLSEKNVPFASARAVTECAKFVKEKALLDLPRVFQTRGSWLSRGIRVRSADWRQNPQIAFVGTVDPYMAQHQFGAYKTPQNAEQGIPEAGSPLPGGMEMPRGTAGGKTTPRGSRWPRHLLAAIQSRNQARRTGKRNRNKATINKLLVINGGGARAIVVRIKFGKGSNSGRGQFKVLWFLTRKPVEIHKRWYFLEKGHSQIMNTLPWFLRKYMDEAIKNG